MSESNEGSASLLGTFGEQFKPSTEPSMRLGQMPEMTKSPYTPLSQVIAGESAFSAVFSKLYFYIFPMLNASYYPAIKTPFARSNLQLYKNQPNDQ